MLLSKLYEGLTKNDKIGILDENKQEVTFMTDLEQRAHDIAVRLLPELMKEENVTCYVRDYRNGELMGEKINDYEILHLYSKAYEALLKGLQKFAGF